MARGNSDCREHMAKTPTRRESKKGVVQTPAPKAVKKPSVKKTSARKIAAKPTAPKKPAPKKPALKKNVTQTVQVKKTETKKVATKQASVQKQAKAKAPASKLSVTKTDALGVLRTDLGKVESKLKRANTMTRKDVKALQAAFATLENRLGDGATPHHAALTHRVDQLSAKLTHMVSRTEEAVRQELKAALNNPTIEGLQSALRLAEARITRSETLRNAAVAKINRHIADMALAVDAQLKQQAKTQADSMAALRTETEKTQGRLVERIGKVEEDSASAFRSVGDRVATLADELKLQNETRGVLIKEQISELALKTQQDFEEMRDKLDRRMEALEDDQRALVNAQERLTASLQARLENLEYGAQTFVATPSEASADPSYPAMPPATQTLPTPQSAVPISIVEDAFSPAPVEHLSDAAIPPNPYQAKAAPAAQMQGPQTQGQTRGQIQEKAQTSAAPNPVPASQNTHMPQEFNPAMFAATGTYGKPTAFAPKTTDHSPQMTVQATPHIAPPHPKAAPQITAQNTPSQMASPTVNADGSLNFDNAALPYANPAYAEAPDQTMDAARPGDFSKKDSKIKKLKLPPLSPSNKRLAALAASVAVISLVGVNLLKDNTPATSAPLPSQVAQPSSAPVTAPPIQVTHTNTGKQDIQTPTLDPASQTTTNLEAAANAGDPIAQFQLGLSYLQNGRTDEAVRLIRAASDQNQPAAQYRLAKLYEVGEGVEADASTARLLTERAARNGNRIAMHDLALYYAEGRGGVDVDMTTAAKWFEKAAERGVVDSQFNLGVLFESGQGLPQNLTEAYVWYSIAARQGDQLAGQRIDILGSQLNAQTKSAADTRITNFKPSQIDNNANGIFQNLAWASTKDKTRDIAQVRQVQTLLTGLGYDAGGADGALGPKTRTAIISFERANGLPETGRVNAELIDRLELAAGA